MRTRTFAVVAPMVVGLAAVVSAQWGWGRLPEGPGVAPRFPPRHFGDGTFVACKMMYESVRSEPQGVGWSTDYPYAGVNLMTRVGELTKTPVSRDRHGNPNYWVVRLTDDALFECPFLLASDVGTIGLSEEEVARLRDYLLKGGFLWVDDFWGSRAWDHWSREIRRVVPEHQIVAVPPDHPVRHTLFRVETVRQVTNINFWRRTGGYTQERGEDSPHATLSMIADRSGRIMVLMTHNTDTGDSWERESEDREFFLQFSPEGYALGINVVLYALTH